MADLLAVDAILLPPIEILQWAVELNRNLQGVDDQPIHLVTELGEEGGRDCLPHITLAMGVLPADRVDQAVAALAEIAQTSSPLELVIPKTETVELPDGRTPSYLDVTKTDQLQQLHESVLNRLISLFTVDEPKPEMFQPPYENTSYLKSFVTEHAFEHYDSHITLGFGKTPELPEPVSFTADTLMLCHMGTSNTSRKVLGEAKLG